MICDLCLSPEPIWDYPTPGASPAPTAPGASPFDAVAADGFAVCGICAALVEEQAWPQLIERIVDVQPIHVPEGTELEGGVVLYPTDRDVLTRGAAHGIVVFTLMRSQAGYPPRIRIPRARKAD